MVTNQAIDNVLLARKSRGALIPSWTILLSSRLQNVLLGVASVSFWRVSWYVWEDFLGGATLRSAWAAHLIGFGGSIALGSFANVTFPPAIDVLRVSNVVDELDETATGHTCSQIRWFSIGREEPDAEQRNENLLAAQAQPIS